MKIAVFLGALDGNKEEYRIKARELGDMFDMMLKTGFAKPEFFRNLVMSDDLEEIKMELKG